MKINDDNPTARQLWMFYGGLLIFLGFVESVFLFSEWWHRLHAQHDWAPLAIGVVVVFVSGGLMMLSSECMMNKGAKK